MKSFALCVALIAVAPSAFAVQLSRVERSPTAPAVDIGSERVTCSSVTTIYSATPQMACLTAGQRASAAAAAANEQQDALRRQHKAASGQTPARASVRN